MKITFVVLGSEQLAVSQLSAIAKRDGHEVGLAFSASMFNDRFNLEIPSLGRFFDDRGEVMSAIRQQQPDVLAFSSLTSTYQWMLGIAREAKQMLPHVKTVFGGVHPSAVPDRVLARPQVDYVVVGEGDVAFPLILKAIGRGGTTEPICNTRFKLPDGTVVRGKQEGFVQDLDSLPHYDKELWEDHIRIGDLYLTMASRGCPYRCSFCFNNFFAELPDDKKSSGKYVRQRSVEHMMEELLWAKKRYNIKWVDFQDDIFTVRKSWLKAFLKRYKEEIDIPFQCLTHPRYMDDDIARWLKEAGCVWIQMGVQSMDEEFKYQNLKRYEKSDHVVKALEAMNRAGLKPKVDHMFGLPGEPIEAQRTALRLYAEQSPKRIQTFWTCFLPGTDILKQGIMEGIVSPEQVERLNEGKDFYFFRNVDSIKNPEMVKTYKAYEIIFRIMPIVPAFLRKRLSPRFFRKVPELLVRPLAATSDAVVGLLHGNPEFIAYGKHYLYHLYRFACTRIGIGPPKATRPKQAGAAPLPNRVSENERASNILEEGKAMANVKI